MTLRKLGLVAVSAAVALVPVSAAMAAKVVVVRSVGPSAKAYPPGKALTDSSSIKLSSGDMVMLLGPSSAKTLRGPGVFMASTSDKSLASAAGRRSRMGALRTGEIAKNPGLWDLDVTQGGKMCVADSGKLKLWRPTASAAAKVSIRGAGKEHAIDFAPGQASVPWPSHLPVGNGAEYQVSVEGGESSKLAFVTVKSPPSDLPGAAQLLIEKGCQNQLDLLVASAGKAGN